MVVCCAVAGKGGGWSGLLLQGKEVVGLLCSCRERQVVGLVAVAEKHKEMFNLLCSCSKKQIDG